MRKRYLPICLLTFVLAAHVTPAAAQSKSNARSEALDIDDKDRALVAKETVKQNKQQRDKSGKSSSNANCGQVDIGNDSSSKKGSSQIADRQKTVIVTGNVINTANCK